MKTIEEAGCEFANNLVIQNSKNSVEEFEISIISFKAGVELANRWVSVEEELPENIKVIAKLKNETFMIANMMNGTLLAEQIEYLGITHWRPIEIK